MQYYISSLCRKIVKAVGNDVINSKLPVMIELKTRMLLNLSASRQKMVEYDTRLQGAVRKLNSANSVHSNQDGAANSTSIQNAIKKTQKLTTRIEILKERLETMIDLELNLDPTHSPKLKGISPPGFLFGSNFGSKKSTSPKSRRESTTETTELDKKLIEGDLDIDAYAFEVSKLVDGTNATSEPTTNASENTQAG